MNEIRYFSEKVNAAVLKLYQHIAFFGFIIRLNMTLQKHFLCQICSDLSGSSFAHFATFNEKFA